MSTWLRLQNPQGEGGVAASVYGDSAVILVPVLHPRPFLLQQKVNTRQRLSTCLTWLARESAKAVELVAKLTANRPRGFDDDDAYQRSELSFCTRSWKVPQP